MKKYLLIIILLSAKALGTIKTDSVGVDDIVYYDVKIMAVSKDKKWIAFRKFYLGNSDTIIVKKTVNNNASQLKFSGFTSSAFFIGKKAIILHGNKKAVYKNLQNGHLYEYKDVKKISFIKEKDQYYILDHLKNLKSYNQEGGMIFQTSNVTDMYVPDSEGDLYAHQIDGNRNDIVKISGNRLTRLYSTPNSIKSFESFTTSGKIILTELDKDSKKIITVIDKNTGSFWKTKLTFDRNDRLIIKELGANKGLFVTAIKRMINTDKSEAWYSNKANLIESEKGLTLQPCTFIWKYEDNEVVTIPKNDFSVMIPSQNSDYLLAFKQEVQGDLINFFYDLDFSIFNIKTSQFQYIDRVKGSEMYISPQGKYLIYPNIKDQWVLFNLYTFTKTYIGSNEIKNPVFSKNNEFILFETTGGILKYHLQTDTKEKIALGPDKIEIVNSKRESLVTDSFYRIYQTILNSNSKILLKITGEKYNTTSYKLLKNNKIENVIESSTNRITNLDYDQNIGKIFAVEENDNLPPQIFTVDLVKKVRQDIFNVSINNKIKREFVDFLSTDGKSIKSVLYFPLDFAAEKKYPMVVHIYEQQFRNLNKYVFPGLGIRNPLGFDLYALLKKGYFVYFPDILPESVGPGLSALQCVYNALDAVKTNKNINHNKIGLIGHSFGGYETNFIATYSNRFAAYISGAGHSDIIKAYYAYNYNFNIPYYFQFETGIYNMKTSYSSNKKLYADNNPIYYVENVTAPIFLWAGKNDKNVPWDHTLGFFTALKRNNKKTIALLFPERTHDLQSGTPESAELYQKMLDWWDYYLKDETDKAWINKLY